MREITTYDELRVLVGQDLGASDWIRIGQDQVDLFGQAIEDQQWIHCDPERARRESPFGQTIVHGMLLLGLLGRLRNSVEGLKLAIPTRLGIFYGFDRVRFVHPVPVGARVRLRLKIKEARLVEPKVIHIVYQHELQIEDQTRPALVADAINRIYTL